MGGDDRPFLCFVHIERAGGTTLHGMLENARPGYVSLKSWDRPGDHRNILTPEKLRFFLRCVPFAKGVGGHTTRSFLGYETVLRDRCISYITFVRRPVERYMSHFNYQRMVMGHRWSLEGFLADERFANFQTKRIAGGADVGAAKAALREKFAFVGLTDRYDESLVLLRRVGVLPGGATLNYERMNELRGSEGLLTVESLDRRLRDQVQQANALDEELYEFAVREFRTRLALAGEEVEAEVASSRSSNQGYRYPRRTRARRVLYRAFVRLLVEPLMHSVARRCGRPACSDSGVAQGLTS